MLTRRFCRTNFPLCSKFAAERGVRVMKHSLLLIPLILLAACASKVQLVERFALDSQEERASESWLEGIWKFDVTHRHQEFSYSFTALFTQDHYHYETCMWLSRDDFWKVLEIPEYKTDDRVQRDIAAAYRIEGAYLEIYVPSNLCDHSFEILRAKLSENQIKGFQTYSHLC